MNGRARTTITGTAMPPFYRGQWVRVGQSRAVIVYRSWHTLTIKRRDEWYWALPYLALDAWRITRRTFLSATDAIAGAVVRGFIALLPPNP